MSTNTCACGNTLIWLSERMAGECNACTWRQAWEFTWRMADEALEGRRQDEPDDDDEDEETESSGDAA